MKTKHQYLLFFYWIALLADCYLIYDQQEGQRWITKGILMPLMLIYYIANTARRRHFNSKVLTITALLLAWAGDLVLLREGQSYFITGLILFLLMHLLYIIYFWRMHRLFPIPDMTTFVIPLALIVVFDFFVMKKMLPLAGDLGKPLIAYIAVISVMFIMACNILSSKKAKSIATSFFIPGSLLFILSDTLLGFNMFLWEDHLIGIGVMLTYGYAQYLIVHGFIKHVRGNI